MLLLVRWAHHMMKRFLQTLDAGAELESDHPGFNVSQSTHWLPFNPCIMHTAP